MTTAVAAEPAADCSLARQMVLEKEQTIYVVSRRAKTLYMISRDLYGVPEKWNEIARANRLTAPYTLKIGQRLIIPGPPTQTDAEGAQVLITTATKFNSTQQSARLSSYVKNCATEKIEPSAVAAALKPPIKKITPIDFTETEKIVAAAPPPIPMPTAAPESETANPSNDKSWEFSAGLIGSMISVKSKLIETSVSKTINSNVNYGAELGLARKLSEKWILALIGGIEHVEFQGENADVLEHNKFDFFEVNLNLDYEFNEAAVAGLGLSYAQRPFAKPTENGVAVEAISIPEFSLGGRLRLVEFGHLKTWVTGEGIYSAQKHEKNEEAKEGYGYSAGLRFDNHFDSMNFILSSAYRVLKQDTKETEEAQEGVVVFAGFEW